MDTIQKDQKSSPIIKVYSKKTIVKQPEILNKKFPIKILNDRLVHEIFPSKSNSNNQEKLFIPRSKVQFVNVKLKDQPTAICNSKQEELSQINNNKSENVGDVSVTPSQNNKKDLSTSASIDGEDDEDLDVEIQRDAKTGQKTLVFKKKNQTKNKVKDDDEDSSVKSARQLTSNNDKIIEKSDLSAVNCIIDENNENSTKIEENVLEKAESSLPISSVVNEVKCLESNQKITVTKDLSKPITTRKTTQLSKPSTSTLSTKNTSKVKTNFVFDSVCVPIGEKKLYSRRPKTPEYVYRKFKLPVAYPSNNSNPHQNTIVLSDEGDDIQSSENSTKTSETTSEQQQKLIIKNPNQTNAQTKQPTVQTKQQILPLNTGQVMLIKKNPPIPPLAPIPQLQIKKLPKLLPKVPKKIEAKLSPSKSNSKQNSSDSQQNHVFLKYKLKKNSQNNITPLNQIVVLQNGQNSNNFQPVVLQNGQNSNNFQQVVLQNGQNSNNFQQVVLQNGQNSNNFHPVVLQNVQNSNNFHPVILQNVQNSNNFHPVILQNSQNSNNFHPVVLQNSQNSNNFHPVVLPVTQPIQVTQKPDANESVASISLLDEDTVTVTNIGDHNYNIPTSQQKVFAETLKSKSIYNLTSELKSKFVPLIGHACTATIIDHLGMAYSRCRNSHVTALRDLIQYVDNFKKYRQHKHGENNEIYENETVSTIHNQNLAVEDAFTMRETNTVSTQTDLTNQDLDKKLSELSQETREKYKNHTNNLPVTDLLSIYREWKNATVPDPTGNMPIHRAVMDNDFEMVKRQCIILKNMNKINIQNKSHHRTALHVAVVFQADMEIVNLLLSSGVNPELQDMSGDNCIHLAVRYGSAEQVDFILKYQNFDTTIINTYNFNGFTPLMLCAEHNKLEIAKILLDNYANPNIQNPKSGRTVLFQAIEYNDHDLVKLLINSGADPKKRDFNGIAPQDAATELETQPDIRHTIFKVVSQNIVTQQRKRQRNYIDEQSTLLQPSSNRKFRKIDESLSILLDDDFDS